MRLAARRPMAEAAKTVRSARTRPRGSTPPSVTRLPARRPVLAYKDWSLSRSSQIRAAGMDSRSCEHADLGYPATGVDQRSTTLPMRCGTGSLRFPQPAPRGGPNRLTGDTENPWRKPGRQQHVGDRAELDPGGGDVRELLARVATATKHSTGGEELVGYCRRDWPRVVGYRWRVARGLPLRPLHDGMCCTGRATSGTLMPAGRRSSRSSPARFLTR